MANNVPHKVTIILTLSFFILVCSPLMAADQAIISGPEPFSLDGGSAIYCIHLLKTVRFFELRDENGKSEIVNVETVWSWFLEYDEEFPEGYRKRYDIIVNGSALDWDNSFIEYGGEMINLRLLFLYRNQHPPESFKQYMQF